LYSETRLGAGCQKVFAERVSWVARRERLEAALDYVREGDTLIVTRPDRLARSTADLLTLVTRLEAKSVGLVILSMGGQHIDTANATGKLMLTMLAAIAAFERDLIWNGSARASRRPRRPGNTGVGSPTARRQTDTALKLKAEGMHPLTIAKHLGISRASVYSILRGHYGYYGFP
jgi:DNA invertase Pin-like site-specific DNA recombinase